MRRELEPVLALVKILPPAELPAFIGALEEIRVTALARFTNPAIDSRPDKSLTIKQASKRMGVGQDYLYRHWQQFKFARQEGRKILFSSNGIDAHLKGKSR
jgi:hypothetical protein